MPVLRLGSVGSGRGGSVCYKIINRRQSGILAAGLRPFELNRHLIGQKFLNLVMVADWLCLNIDPPAMFILSLVVSDCSRLADKLANSGSFSQIFSRLQPSLVIKSDGTDDYCLRALQRWSIFLNFRTKSSRSATSRGSHSNWPAGQPNVTAPQLYCLAS